MYDYKLSQKCFKMVQYEFNPETGESLNFDKRNIQQVEEMAKNPESGIVMFAAICHYKDRYQQINYDNYLKRHGHKPKWKVGDMMPTHWHLVLYTDDKFNPQRFGQQIGLSYSMTVTLLKPVRLYRKEELGYNYENDMQGFIDCCRYLTHEDKTQHGVSDKEDYKKSDVISNFDYEGLVWNDDYGWYYK